MCQRRGRTQPKFLFLAWYAPQKPQSILLLTTTNQSQTAPRSSTDPIILCSGTCVMKLPGPAGTIRSSKALSDTSCSVGTKNY